MNRAVHFEISADDIQNLAAFFASQKTSPSTAATNEAGAKLYLSGDPKKIEIEKKESRQRILREFRPDLKKSSGQRE